MGVLKSIELVYEASLFPELVYMFKHTLIQDVAYNSLLVRRRKELHALIARTIERVYEGRLSEHYDVLAHHYSAGEIWDKAASYFQSAGERAADAFAVEEALGHYEGALDALSRLGEGPDPGVAAALHGARADLYLLLSDFGSARGEAERAMGLARKGADRSRESQALLARSFALLFGHELDRAIDSARETIEVARAASSAEVTVGARFVLAEAHAVTGRLDIATQQAEEGLACGAETGGTFHDYSHMLESAVIGSWQGRYAEAMQWSSKGIASAREHNNAMGMIWTLWGKGLACTGAGRYDEALRVLEDGLELAEKVGEEFARNRYLNTLGWLFAECGDHGRAADLNRRGRDFSHGRSDPEVTINSELNLADIHLVDGNLAEALELLEGCRRLAGKATTSDWMRWRYSMHLFASLGELWRARGDARRARECANQCLEVATRTRSLKYVVKGLRVKGEAAAAGKQWDEAQQYLRRALEAAESIGNPTQLWRTHAALGELLERTDRREEARDAYREGCAVIRRTLDDLHDPGLGASLSGFAPVTRLFDLAGETGA